VPADLPADLVTQASASISETIQVVNSLGGDEHLLSSAKLAFSASHSLVLGASVLLILLAVVVWFTLPERKIRQLGKQRATPH
jgi:DHA2 family multidrug resistance protein-like MFS transporter